MTTATASRVVTLEGGFNVRDLGGYKSSDGRTVKWGKLFRSGHLSQLTPQDIEILAQHHITEVHDFRGKKEQASMPSKPVQAKSYDQYHILSGSMPLYRKLIERGELNTDTAHQTFINIYKKFAHEVTEPFRRMFPLLIDNSERASLFHCSAGKDRTGIAAALILSALGVPRQTIIEDYLLTAQYMDREHALDMIEGFLDVNGENTEQVERDWLVPIVSVHEDFIGSFFSSLEAEYGSVENYLEKALMLSADKLQQMRDAFLER